MDADKFALQLIERVRAVTADPFAENYIAVAVTAQGYAAFADMGGDMRDLTFAMIPNYTNEELFETNDQVEAIRAASFETPDHFRIDRLLNRLDAVDDPVTASAIMTHVVCALTPPALRREVMGAIPALIGKAHHPVAAEGRRPVETGDDCASASWTPAESITSAMASIAADPNCDSLGMLASVAFLADDFVGRTGQHPIVLYNRNLLDTYLSADFDAATGRACAAAMDPTNGFDFVAFVETATGTMPPFDAGAAILMMFADMRAEGKYALAISQSAALIRRLAIGHPMFPESTASERGGEALHADAIMANIREGAESCGRMEMGLGICELSHIMFAKHGLHPRAFFSRLDMDSLVGEGFAERLDRMNERFVGEPITVAALVEELEGADTPAEAAVLTSKFLVELPPGKRGLEMLGAIRHGLTDAVSNAAVVKPR